MSAILVLNFTYEVLHISSFQRAVKLIFSGKAEIVHDQERVLASPTFRMQMPSIIRMLYYILWRQRRLFDDRRSHRSAQQRWAVHLGKSCLRVHPVQQAKK